MRLILCKDPDERTDKELEQLLPLLNEIRFFKERELTLADIQEVASYLRYEAFMTG